MTRSEAILLATHEHASDILPLMVAFNQHEGIVWRPDVMVPALHRLLDDGSLGLVLAAYVGPRLVGYSLATFGYDIEFAGRDAFITELFIEPASRGQGLGRRLLESTVQHLQQRNVLAVHLVVRPDNPRARSLYEAHGFEASPRILMTKALTSDEAS